MDDDKKTELIFGVTHSDEYYDIASNFLRERFPAGIESLMLKLPLWYQEYDYLDYNFFDKLRKEYESKGTRIIFGDTKIKRVPKKIDQALRITKLPGFDPKNTKIKYLDYLNILCYGLGSMAWTIFAHTRDKGMLKTMEDETPQVVVVGTAHADYLKRKHPEIHYVSFYDPRFKDEHHLMKYILRTDPHNPDETIDIEGMFSGRLS